MRDITKVPDIAKHLQAMTLLMLALLVFLGVLITGELVNISNNQRQEITQLKDLNDNVCNQSAYSAGSTCQGG